ncbi:MAG: quinone-dependent dihydroorotate dehydrogenase [Chloroflexota bacterium]
MYDLLYHHLLTRFDPELTHHMALDMLRYTGNLAASRVLVRRLLASATDSMAISAIGLDFEHPLGMAAGFDKNAVCIRGLGMLGFSSVEVGTVTPQAQSGNPRPRLFRLPEDQALINSLGFPSAGMLAVEHNLRRSRPDRLPVGVSLGKNKVTPLENAHMDYSSVLERLYPYADFFVINVSSPNTPGLRDLQTRDYLSPLLKHLQTAMVKYGGIELPKPLLLKLSPDMTWPEIDSVLELALEFRLAGVVATNTTTDRAAIHSHYRDKPGGVSGRPLRQRSNEIVQYTYRHTQGQLCIIGVGGIFSGDDVWESLSSGASLVQAYTGLVYRGPTFVKQVIQQIQQRMHREGIQKLQDIIGSEVKRN